jgi:hypothetical protein
LEIVVFEESRFSRHNLGAKSIGNFSSFLKYLAGSTSNLGRRKTDANRAGWLTVSKVMNTKNYICFHAIAHDRFFQH